MMTAGALLGCGNPHSRARAGSVLVDSRGDTAAPAVAVRTVTRETINLPAGSVIERDEPGSRTPGPVTAAPAVYVKSPAPAEMTYKATLSAPASIVRETTRDELRTATAHAPPDPAEQAKADGVRSYWRLSVLCFVLAAFLAWRRHWMGAACAGLAGAVLPLLASFHASRWGEITGGVLVGAAVAFFAAWHVLRLRGKLPVDYPRQA